MPARRCAIYTWKSVEEGLDKEFNTLDAQRESCEAYIASQKSLGWQCLPAHYDDGGFSGGNIERPAMQRLLADCEAGLVDVIVVYKIDRLTRSISDFAALSKMLDRWNVSFVSITQQIDTSTSAGRMILNVLVTFAQYEREVIAERIRDKMAATRKKGKWAGGMVPFGYRVDNHRLVPNPETADVVRRIFRRFLEIQSPKAIALELNKDGIPARGGATWTTQHIYRILNNHTYIGRVLYKGEEYEGEHDAIIDAATWNRAHEYLRNNMPIPDRSRSLDSGTALKGLVRCQHCGCAMTPVHSNKAKRRYYYYKCVSDARRPESDCPVKTIPVGELDTVVFSQLRRLFAEPEVLAAVAREAEVDSTTVLELLQADIWERMTLIERQRIMQQMLSAVEVGVDGIRLEVKINGFTTIKETYGHHRPANEDA